MNEVPLYCNNIIIIDLARGKTHALDKLYLKFVQTKYKIV